MQVQEAIYRHFFHHTNDLIQGVGPDGRFRFVNQRWLQIMGYTETEAYQLHFEQIVHPEHIEHCRRLFKSVQAGQHCQQLETIFVTKSGQKIHVDGNVNACMEDGRFLTTLGVFRDITPRLDVENQLRASLKRTAALYQIARSQIAYQNLPRLLQIVTNSVAEVLPADRVILYTVDIAKKEVIHFAKGGPGAENIIRYTFQAIMDGLPGWVLRHQQPALALKNEPDPRVSSAIFERRAELNIGSIIVVPVHYQGQTMGTLIAMNGYKQPDFTEQDKELMMAMSNHVALALENVRLYEAEQQRTRELQAHNEELDAFAHTVAHDLKAPLSNLIGFAEMLALDSVGLDDFLHRQATHIHNNGRKMNNIIDELLLLSQVRKADLEVVPVNIGRTVHEAIERLADLVEEHRPQITQPDAWPMALGYASWIEEIWVNYISNAIKYGGASQIVRLNYQHLPHQLIRFEVTDNGHGMTVEEQGRLFRPFERLEQLGKIEGHGLGLSIVRRIAEKLGGQVGVESQPGQGSTFYFILPAANSHHSK
ncbi:MAG: PAS domain S-box protein [Ardenticatenaceae bacterium]|nr:PAS domain S-box protein [Ardenticatenaceae bacterium]